MKNRKIKKPEWKNFGNNSVLEFDKFFISYNPNPVMGNGSETALVKDGSYYILYGDWREEYGKIANLGFEKCKELFDKNDIGKNVNPWSN